MSWERSATGRRSTLTNLKASNLISTMLLSQANNGASGKAATKIVMKPNCMTENVYMHVNTTFKTINLRWYVRTSDKKLL